MVQDILWKVGSFSACQRITCSIYEIRRFITDLQSRATGPYPEPAKSTSSQWSIHVRI